MIKICLLSAITLAFFLMFPLVDAQACTCAGPRTFGGKNFQPCGIFWGAEAVFIGKVDKLATEKVLLRGTEYTSKVIAHFSVEKPIRGVSEKKFEIETSPSGGKCGYSFVEGETYFVYVNRNKEGKFVEWLCGATVPLKNAAADLEYLRAVEAGETGGRVFGYVSRRIQNTSKEQMSNTGIAGVKVTLKSVKVGGAVPKDWPKYVKRSFETVTNDDGYYIFYRIPDGSYYVNAEIPAPLRSISTNNSGPPYYVDIYGEKRRCGGANFAATSLALIEGRVLNGDGSPPPQQYILLLPVRDDGAIQTDKATANSWINPQTGYYGFDLVPAGKYVVAVNPKGCPGPYAPQYGPSYLPGVLDKSDATVITVTENRTLKLPEYKLPPVLEERVFSGIVRSADGRPAGGAKVFLFDSNVNRCMNLGSQRETVTDQEGRFKLSGFEGYGYRLRAYIENQPTSSKRLYSKIIEIPVSQSLENIELSLNDPY